ncbi:MAG: hypothetical protein ACD_18C00314G0012 [uncultured bacterium]|nr:MAG: hypothetical protein ACD_18C00314G0012 [uncultured bacterium]OGH89606.1 MAG: hypothetical protein A2507_02450 [Candidatus Magasanikbacteria bacterium RIFOXYD12_FULL_33_17]HAO52164.1 hypothetical protein [Candidatus Magasanikbacteria bacterium]
MRGKETFVGLDIADHTISTLELSGSEKKPTLKNFNRVVIEPGVIEWGRIKNPQKLSEIFKQLFLVTKTKEIKLENVVVSLPDSLVYVHIFHLPPHNKRDREKLVLKELQGIIPEKINNILYSYQVFSEDNDVVKGMLVALPKDAASDWFDFFEKNRIKVKFFDIEPVALRRAIFFGKKDEKICLVDLGAQSTSINILNKVRFYFSYNNHIAGDFFTREISNKLNLSLEEAEQKKIKNGLNGVDEDVNDIIKSGLDKLIADIKNIIEVNDDAEHQITKIVLVGGTSKMNGLIDYIQKHFEFPVELLNISKSFTNDDIEYAESFGLALRSFSSKDYEDEPFINQKQITKNSGALKILKKEDTNYIKNLDEHFDLASVSSDVNFDRYNPDRNKISRILWFVIPLFVSIILLIGAFFYRAYSRDVRERNLDISKSIQDVVQYKLQDISVKIPVATIANEYTKDRIRGRIFNDVILKLNISEIDTEDYIVSLSKERAVAELSVSEEIYQYFLEKIDNKDDFNYRWLILSSLDIKTLAKNKIDSMNTSGIAYLFEEYSISSVEKTSDSNLYILNIVVKVSSKQELNLNN